MGGPGTGNVGHFDVAVDVAHQKISVDVADHDVPFVDSLDFDVDVARNTQLKIHLDDVALEFTMPAPVVAMTAKGTVDVELQRALLLGDVEGDVLAGLFELVFGFCAGGFVDGELHLVRICAYYFDGTPDVVNLQRFIWDTGHGKGFPNGFLLLHRQVAIGIAKGHEKYEGMRKLQVKRRCDIHYRMRDRHGLRLRDRHLLRERHRAYGLRDQGDGKQTAA